MRLYDDDTVGITMRIPRGNDYSTNNNNDNDDTVVT